MAEEVADELDPVTARRWAVGICAFTGAWGVLTGFAVFILIRTGDFSHPAYFALALGVATGASFIVETLRESVRGEIAALPTRRIGPLVITVLTLLVFELFIFATHNAIDIASHEKDVTELREALLGPGLIDASGTSRDLVVLALLWLIPGAAVGWLIGLFIVDDRSADSMRLRAVRSGGRGMLVAVVAAPVVVFAYVFFWRAVVALRLAIFAPLEWQAHYDSILGLFSNDHHILAGYAGLIFYGGTFAMLGILKLWLWSIAGKAIDIAVLSLLISVGWRFKEWRPLGIVVAGFVIGIVAPLYVDFGDVVKLTLFAAAVWFIPGLVLGLAAPLLDRPSERSNWWTSIATTLGLAVAVLTVIRWQFLGPLLYVFVIVSIAFFAVALLFARFRDVQEFWPALAMCLSAVAAGLTFLLASQTASFHTILAEVSAINTLPASIAPNLALQRYREDIVYLKIYWRDHFRLGKEPPSMTAVFERATHGEIPSLAAQERQARIDAQRGDLVTARAVGIAELAQLAADERVHIERSQIGGLRSPLDQAAHSMPGIAALSDASLSARLAEEKLFITAFLDADRANFTSRSEHVRESALMDFDWWNRFGNDLDVAGSRVLWIDRFLGDLATIESHSRQEMDAARTETAYAASIAPEQLEVSLAGSFAFWMTVGILSAWAIRRRSMAGAE